MTRDSIEHLNTFGLAVDLFVIRNNQYAAGIKSSKVMNVVASLGL